MASALASGRVDSPLDLNLLLIWPERRPFWSWAAIGTAATAIQAAFFVCLLALANVPAAYTPNRVIVVQKTPLYLPPELLTQKAPNRTKPTENIDLADLLPKQAKHVSRPAPAPSTRHFEIPKPAVVQPKSTPQIEPQASNLAMDHAPPNLPPGATNGLPIPAPPPPQKDAADNNPFQDIGEDNAPVNPHPTLHVPKATVDGAIAGLAPTPNAKHMIVTDDSTSPRSMPGMPGSVGQSAAQHVEVELKSDTEAPDFRDYLARILTVVRANWRRVTPESVRMGTLRGENTIELIINRDGFIPKLVIGQPSNVDALDRASVAGVSMSNPLPPLPADFKGEQVRLAFTFKYNVQE